MAQKFSIQIPSRDNSSGDQITIQIQDWDSQILKRSCAQIVEITNHNNTPSFQTKKDYSALISQLNERGLQYVIARRTVNEWANIHALERAGFQMVDGILNFRLQLSGSQTTSLSSNIRLVGAQEAQTVANLSAEVFNQGRFFNDPLITSEQAKEIHYEWGRNSCLGRANAVFVVESRGQVQGFVTCKLQQNVGIIELIGVKKEFAGQGLGRQLVETACSWFLEKKCDEVQVQTQTTNYGAILLYCKTGFRPFSNSVTLRWAP